MARTPVHPVDPLFVSRWSPRSFTAEPVPDAVLLSIFEAARWAPSASNAQPWRFLLARRDDAHWPAFAALLHPRNALWALKASALILILSETTVSRRGEIVENVSHSFDSGAAWANLAHQAHLLGWATHAIGGFDRQAARAGLSIPDTFAIEAMVALGRAGGLDGLDAAFHASETPTDRRPLAETVFGGRLGAPAFHPDRSAA